MCSEITRNETPHHHDPLLAKFVDVDFSSGLAQTETATDARSRYETASGQNGPLGGVLSGNMHPLTARLQRYRNTIVPTVDPLIAAQRDIIEKYGAMDLSINPLGLFKREHEGAGFLPSHAFKLLDGYGLAMARLNGDSETDPTTGRVRKNLSEPDLLFYAPKDPKHPNDKEYVLIGWGWFSDYEPGNPPMLTGVNDSDWFIHESGWHTADGGFIATPPEEDFAGQIAAPAPTRRDHKPGQFTLGAHPRVWDLHYWRTDLISGMETAPTPGMEAPEELERKMLPENMMALEGTPFFYPDRRSFAGGGDF